MRRVLVVSAFVVALSAPARAGQGKPEDFTFLEAGVTLNARGLSPFPAAAPDQSFHVPIGKFFGTVDDFGFQVGGLGLVTGPLEAMFQFSNVGQPGKGWVEGINFAAGWVLLKPFVIVGAALRFDHLRAGMGAPMTNVCACAWAGGAVPLGVPWAALTYEGWFGTGLYIGNGLIGGGAAALHVTPVAGMFGGYVRYGAAAFRNSPQAGAPFLGSVTEVGISFGSFGVSGL